MIQVEFMTTNHIFAPVRYLSSRSSDTYCWVRLLHVVEFLYYLFLISSGNYCCVHPVLIVMLVRQRLVWKCASSTELCKCMHLVPVVFSNCVSPIPVLNFQAWIFKLDWSRLVQGIFWFEHSLFIGDHDTFHQSCLSCHDDEVIPLKIDVSSNCNFYGSIWCYLQNLIVTTASI
jgi:hypothetical protein